VQPKHEDFIYWFLKDSHSAWLEQHHLLWRCELAASATVHSLIAQVSNDMRNSPSAYQFAPIPSRTIGIIAHETLPLQLYGLVARGVPHPCDQLVHIVCMPTDPYFTLEMVTADKRQYAAPVCIEGDRFVIHLSKQYQPASSFLALTNFLQEWPSLKHQLLSTIVGTSALVSDFIITFQPTVIEMMDLTMVSLLLEVKQMDMIPMSSQANQPLSPAYQFMICQKIL